MIKPFANPYNTRKTLKHAPRPMREVVELVCEHRNVSITEILIRDRRPTISYARHLCFYLAREFGHQTFENIGFFIGDRDHTTALHGHKTIAGFMTMHEDVKAEVDYLIAKLNRVPTASPAATSTKEVTT